jgi:nitrogen fixation protein NifZ
MHSRWDLGDSVRVTRNVRNDGTYSGALTGDLLIRRGSVGAVVDIGTFLQDQIIYSVHFLDHDRIVGCREEELIGGDEPWVPSAFEARERVLARQILALGSDDRVPRGSPGEVLRILRDADTLVYHVHFDCLPGRTLAVPESALAGLAEALDV